MQQVASTTRSDAAATPGLHREAIVRLLRGALEGIVLLLVALSPWAFGAIHPLAVLGLYIGVAVVLALWGARLLVEGRLCWSSCPVLSCLAALLLLGAGQLLPLSPSTLAWLSPPTAELCTRLQPEEREVLPEGDQAPVSATTLTLYPEGTRGVLVQLLAVLALFAAVRNNACSADSLRRLSLVAAANGALLSLFALVQFFTSPPNVVYWSFPTQGIVFGPFICRTHFSCYVNMCVGLGFGLLLATTARPHRGGSSWGERFLLVLRHPATLGVGLGLGLMLAAVAYSMCRGGAVALAGAALVCLPLLLLRDRGWKEAATVAGAGLVGLALVGWFGLGVVESRLATVWKGDALEQSRLPLWKRSATLAMQFPVWGTGYGTFELVEPTCRTPADSSLFVYDHAHNDYLEVLIEGGVVGLGLALATIFFVHWRGCWGYLERRGSESGGLALGALFAFTTLVIHSFGDFGLHYPAIALLATVVCAQLAGLPAAGQRERGLTGDSSLQGGRLAALACAVVVLGIGLVLISEGWKEERAERLRLAAIRCQRRDQPADRVKAIAYLDAAVRIRPDNALLRFLLAEAHHEEYWGARQQAEDTQQAAVAAGSVLALGRASPIVPPQAGLVNWALGMAGQARRLKDEHAALVTHHLSPALRCYLEARALCPLLPDPNVRLAAHAQVLVRADAPGAYLERACLLLPADARTWYLRGVQALSEGSREQAWASWRRSLECSPTHLRGILTESARELSANDIAERVLPRDASLLQEASRDRALAKSPEAVRVLREKALQLLEHPAAALSGNQLHCKAQILRDLGQPQEAIEAYQAALALTPGQPAWRFELVELLHQQGQLQDARRELRTILAQEPEHQPAKDLYRRVLRQQIDEH
jgi:O-antigen ligase/tetratricopeptide (TPR) repeat protein